MLAGKYASGKFTDARQVNELESDEVQTLVLQLGANDRTPEEPNVTKPPETDAEGP
jgi:hypothetical protein